MCINLFIISYFYFKWLTFNHSTVKTLNSGNKKIMKKYTKNNITRSATILYTCELFDTSIGLSVNQVAYKLQKRSSIGLVGFKGRDETLILLAPPLF